MSSFNFGNNYIEEQFLLVEKLKIRISENENLLKELFDQIKANIKNIDDKQKFELFLLEIHKLPLSDSLKKIICDFCLELFEKKQDLIHNEFLNGTHKNSAVRVFDEWTDSDLQYDIGNWYENISLSIQSDNNKDISHLVSVEQEEELILDNKEYIFHKKEEQEDDINIVVGNENIAHTFGFSKYKISEDLSQIEYPYEYVQEIIDKAKGIVLEKFTEEEYDQIKDFFKDDYHMTIISSDVDEDQNNLSQIIETEEVVMKEEIEELSEPEEEAVVEELVSSADLQEIAEEVVMKEEIEELSEPEEEAVVEELVSSADLQEIAEEVVMKEEIEELSEPEEEAVVEELVSSADLQEIAEEVVMKEEIEELSEPEEEAVVEELVSSADLQEIAEEVVMKEEIEELSEPEEEAVVEELVSSADLQEIAEEVVMKEEIEELSEPEEEAVVEELVSSADLQEIAEEVVMKEEIEELSEPEEEAVVEELVSSADLQEIAEEVAFVEVSVEEEALIDDSLLDIRDFRDTDSQNQFDMEVDFNTPAIYHQKKVNVESEDNIVIDKEDTLSTFSQEEIIEEPIIEQKKADVFQENMSNTLKEEEKEPQPLDSSNKKDSKNCEKGSVITYSDVEDFGNFILYRDLG